jgi:hypothetical protein
MAPPNGPQWPEKKIPETHRGTARDNFRPLHDNRDGRVRRFWHLAEQELFTH